MPRANCPITVTPGDLQQRVEARVKSGAYASASEMLQRSLDSFRKLRRADAATEVEELLRQLG